MGPEIGQMLSLTWSKYANDVDRRRRLYRGMARIVLALARVPQPSIGAYRFRRDGTVTLSNRPLICSAIIMENSANPRTIQPLQTYESVESFTSDMLTLHDNYFLHHPHAVRNEEDAHERMAIRSLLRAVSHHFIMPNWRGGPYLLQMTDFHQSNIFVDDDWNVTGMIDLEWICSLPVEMLSVPHWLTDCSIDDIIGEKYTRFDQARQQFLAVVDEEAESMNTKPKHDIPITSIMRETWRSKAVWFWACIRSINGWLFIFEDHILPKFSEDKEMLSQLKPASALWQEDVQSIVKTKVEDEERYKEDLRAFFFKGNTGQ